MHSAKGNSILYAKVGEGFLYLCVVIDLFSRKVIAHSISEIQDDDLTVQAFRVAHLRRNPEKGRIFHSDQGCQYTSYRFRKLLRDEEVIQSFSFPGSPHDNAVAESFFASFKKEDFRRNFYETEEAFRKAVDEYMDYYNDYRPHQKLGGLTPNQAEQEYELLLKTDLENA